MENFSTTTGQPTNAVYGFTSMLINVLRDETPTHVAVAFDLSQPTFRHEALRRLQGQPRGDPDRLPGPGRPGARGARGAGDPDGVSAPGYEADDVIATLATQAEAQGMDVLIVTGDRDALQLVDEQVTVLMTTRGASAT